MPTFRHSVSDWLNIDGKFTNFSYKQSNFYENYQIKFTIAKQNAFKPRPKPSR